MNRLSGWILVAGAMCFAAGLAAGHALSAVLRPAPLDPRGTVVRWGPFVERFQNLFALDAAQTAMLWRILEARDEEEQRIRDLESASPTVRSRREAADRRAEERILKLLSARPHQLRKYLAMVRGTAEDGR